MSEKKEIYSGPEGVVYQKNVSKKEIIINMVITTQKRSKGK